MSRRVPGRARLAVAADRGKRDRAALRRAASGFLPRSWLVPDAVRFVPSGVAGMAFAPSSRRVPRGVLTS
jgi:hypothetical protein